MKKRLLSEYRKVGLLYRPIINWKKIAVNILLAVVLTMICTALLYIMLKNLGIAHEVEKYIDFIKYVFFLPEDNLVCKLFMLIITLIVLFKLKPMLIFFVQVYQCYAPDSVRTSCRFKPSCSQYMILSIEKYGVIRGGYKGLKRLARCHAPNGGEDYP